MTDAELNQRLIEAVDAVTSQGEPWGAKDIQREAEYFGFSFEELSTAINVMRAEEYAEARFGTKPTLQYLRRRP
jgi:hypothetical protein